MASASDTTEKKLGIGAVAAAITIHVLWGGNPVAVKWGLEVFPPLASGFVRFTIGTIAIGLWAIARGVPLLPPRHEWLPLAGVSVLFTVQIWLMNVGFSQTTGALGSILIALNPLFAAAFAHFFFAGDRLTWMRSAGLLLAFIGTAVILARHGSIDFSDATQAGNWILLLSATLLGWRLIVSARLIRRLDEVRVVLWMLLLSLPMFGLSSWAFETISWQNLGWRPIAGIAYQGLVIAGFAFVVNSYLMKLYSPTIVASFNFVSPAAGLLLSVLLLNETIGAIELTSLALVAAGLVLVARPARSLKS